MNSPLNQDWLEEAARRRVSPQEASRWRSELASRPRELRRLEEELALNALLDGTPRPGVSSRFTAEILESIDRDSAPKSAFHRWVSQLAAFRVSIPQFSLPRLALAGTACAALAFGWNRVEVRRHGILARQAAEITVAAGVPGVAVFGDFEAVRLLSTPVTADDTDLMEALRSDPE
jgi:hypothetical protein